MFKKSLSTKTSEVKTCYAYNPDNKLFYSAASKAVVYSSALAVYATSIISGFHFLGGLSIADAIFATFAFSAAFTFVSFLITITLLEEFFEYGVFKKFFDRKILSKFRFMGLLYLRFSRNKKHVLMQKYLQICRKYGLDPYEAQRLVYFTFLEKTGDFKVKNHLVSVSSFYDSYSFGRHSSSLSFDFMKTETVDEENMVDVITDLELEAKEKTEEAVSRHKKHLVDNNTLSLFTSKSKKELKKAHSDKYKEQNYIFESSKKLLEKCK